MNRKQIMLWEKKIQLKKEARSEFEKQNEEVERLKMELQNKEVTCGLSLPSPKSCERKRQGCVNKERRKGVKRTVKTVSND